MAQREEFTEALQSREFKPVRTLIGVRAPSKSLTWQPLRGAWIRIDVEIRLRASSFGARANGDMGTLVTRISHDDAGILIDTHCHLDDVSFAEDYDTVIAESVQAGVHGWINVGFEPERWQSSIALANRTEGMSVMLGVHPSSADQWSSSTADALRSLLGNSGAVAIGEIGLDFLRQEAPTAESQTQAFNAQLDLAIDLALPAVIHMRESEQAMLRLLRQRSSLPPLLFHSYDGGPELTDYILESDAFVGVGGLATRKSSEGLREQLLRIPLNQIVLETDSPYLMPARMRGRRNTPASVRAIATFLAGVKSEDDHYIASTTTRNAFAFFGKLRTA